MSAASQVTPTAAPVEGETSSMPHITTSLTLVQFRTSMLYQYGAGLYD